MIHNCQISKKDFQVDEQCKKLALVTRYSYDEILRAKKVFMEIKLDGSPIADEKDFNNWVLWVNYKTLPLTF
jgi:hypothetical protein